MKCETNVEEFTKLENINGRMVFGKDTQSEYW